MSGLIPISAPLTAVAMLLLTGTSACARHADDSRHVGRLRHLRRSGLTLHDQRAGGWSYQLALCRTGPADGAAVTGDIPVAATVSVTGADPGVRRMICGLDGVHVLMDFEAPWTFSLPTDSLCQRATAARGDGADARLAGIAAGGCRPRVRQRAGRLYAGDVYEKGTATEFHNWRNQYFDALRAITNPTIGTTNTRTRRARLLRLLGQRPALLQLRYRGLALHLTRQTEVWLDGARIDALSGPAALGSTDVGRLQPSDRGSGRSFDVAFDDVVVDDAARIVVEKRTTPPGTSADALRAFSFTASPPLGGFALTDGERRSHGVPPGT